MPATQARKRGIKWYQEVKSSTNLWTVMKVVVPLSLTFENKTAIN